MKKIISFLMICVLCFTLVPINADAKTKKITIKGYDEYVISDVTYEMPKGWECSNEDNTAYYIYDTKNFIMVQSNSLDIDTGFENDDFQNSLIKGLETSGAKVLSKHVEQMGDGPTALILDSKMNVDKKPYYIKMFCFAYNKNIYTFSFCSATKSNTKILDKIIDRISLNEVEPTNTPTATITPTPTATITPTPTVTPTATPTPIQTPTSKSYSNGNFDGTTYVDK